MYLNACADPESFVRGGSTLTTFFFNFFIFYLMRGGGRIQIPLKVGHHRPASEMGFEWCFADVPIMAHH